MANLKPYEVVTVEHGQNLRMRFRFWVARYGVSRLARSLGARRTTVYSWVHAHHAVIPDVKTVRVMIGLSRIEPLVGCAFGDGPLSYEDILGTVEIVSRETRTEATAAELRNHSCANFCYSIARAF
jgi:hypothetical protein